MTGTAKTSGTVANACARFVRSMVSRGELRGTPIRIDGFGRDELSVITSDLAELLPDLNVHMLGAQNNGLSVTFSRAVFMRNQVTENDPPFVLLVGNDVPAESSLDDAAFNVASRDQVFRWCVSTLDHPQDLERDAKLYGRNTDAESIFKFLSSDGVSYTGNLNPEHLGLLADSELHESSSNLQKRLSQNRLAVRILLDRKTSDHRLRTEFAQELGIDIDDAVEEIAALRGAIAKPLAGSREKYFDFSNWPDPQSADPDLVLVPDLTKAPHTGWKLESRLAVAEQAVNSRIAWDAKPSVRGLTFTVDLHEQSSGDHVVSLGRSSTKSRPIRWARLLDQKVQEHLAKIDPAGRIEGYGLFFLVRMFFSGREIDSAETSEFRVQLNSTQDGDDGDRSKSTPDFTLAQAKYRFAQEFLVDWKSVASKPVTTEWGETRVLHSGTDRDGTRRESVSDLEQDALLIQFQSQIVTNPDTRMYKWNNESSQMEPEGSSISTLLTGDFSEFVSARAKFLKLVSDTGPVELLDLLTDKNARVTAMEYVEQFVGAVSKLDTGSPALADRQKGAALASIDSIRVELPDSLDQALMLIPPTHPTTVGWMLQQALLVEEWGGVEPEQRPSPDAYPMTEHAGPRSLVMPSLKSASHDINWSTYLGSIGSTWQVFSSHGQGVALRSIDWRTELFAAIGGKNSELDETTFSPEIVGRKIANYLKFHPHIQGVNVAAITSGTGRDLLDALVSSKKKIQKSKRARPNLRVDAKLIGSRSSMFAKGLVDFYLSPGDARWDSHAKVLLDSADLPLAPSLSLGMTRLGENLWSDLKDEVENNRLSNTGQGPHITILGPSLPLSVQSVLDSESGIRNTFTGSGLGARPRSLVKESVDDDPFVGDWVYFLEAPRDDESPALSSAWALNKLLSIAHDSQNTIGLGVELSGEISEVLSLIHDVSDWIVLADPMFSTAFFDRPPAAEDNTAVLLDYSPMAAGFQDSQVLVTTKFASELELLKDALSGWDQQNPSGAVNAISSISGRLLLKLSSPTLQTLGELHGLALTRSYIAAQHPGALVVPIDEHAETFSPTVDDYLGKRADLLAIWSNPDGAVVFEVIESKWSGSLSNLGRQLQDGVIQARTTVEFLRAEFIDYEKADLPQRLEHLRGILEFHRERSTRHGVSSNFSAEKLAQLLDTPDKIKFQSSVVGWSPDGDYSSEPKTVDGVSVFEMGQDELRRYTADLDEWPESASSDSRGSEPPKQAHTPSPATGPATKPGRSDRDQPTKEFEPEEVIDEDRLSVSVSLGDDMRKSEPASWYPDKCANGHLVIIGGSGAGKTTTMRKIIGELRDEKLPVLVMDFHGDIDPAQPSQETLIKFTYDQNEQFINPFFLDQTYKDLISPTRVKNEFMEAWRSHYPSMGIQQTNVLRRLIEASFGAKQIGSDPTTWASQIDFGDIMIAFEEAEMRPTDRANLEPYLVRYAESRVFHGGSGIPVEEFISRSYRLDLSQLDEETRNVVADVTLRRLFMLVSALGPVDSAAVGRDKFRVFVAIDEAQLLMRSRSTAKASIAKYTAEARKFGIGLIMATQLKDTIPNDVWGNIDTRFFMKALDRDERIKNAKAAGVAESEISSLSIGGGLMFSSSEPNTRPTRVQIQP
jgi:hypothetical protein